MGNRDPYSLRAKTFQVLYYFSKTGTSVSSSFSLLLLGKFIFVEHKEISREINWFFKIKTDLWQKMNSSRILSWSSKIKKSINMSSLATKKEHLFKNAFWWLLNIQAILWCISTIRVFSKPVVTLSCRLYLYCSIGFY